MMSKQLSRVILAVALFAMPLLVTAPPTRK